MLLALFQFPSAVRNIDFCRNFTGAECNMNIELDTVDNFRQSFQLYKVLKVLPWRKVVPHADLMNVL